MLIPIKNILGPIYDFLVNEILKFVIHVKARCTIYIKFEYFQYISCNMIIIMIKKQNKFWKMAYSY